MDEQNSDSIQQHRRSFLRIYLTGMVCMAIGWAAWRIIDQISPSFRAVSDPWLAGILSTATVILLPIALGALFEFALRPLLGKWRTLSGLLNLHDRFVSELSKENPKIVLVAWPDKSTRTLGVMTSEFPATESQSSMAAVFVPIGSQLRNGYIRIIPMEDLEFTDWSVNDLQLFQLTFGSVAPGQLRLSRKS